MIELEQEETVSKAPVATIKVIGVGGGGGNTLNSIIESGCEGVQCIATNTDVQALELASAQCTTIQLGIKLTKGLGAGANPELGKRAAEEDLDKVMEEVKDAHIVFLTAGMGGGTGSGALPVIAHALREQGILTIAVVTKPFLFEGKRRGIVASEAINRLKDSVDTLIVIPNQKLLEITNKEISMIDAFSMINNVLGQSVKGISDIILKKVLINVDFADVRTIMQLRGVAVMGSAKASGENRAEEAALQAISSPLLENMSIDGAHGVLINITGSPTLGLQEINAAAQVVYKKADEDAHIILGSVIDETMKKDEVSVTIIATGFNEQKVEKVVVQAAIHDKQADSAAQFKETIVISNQDSEINIKPDVQKKDNDENKPSCNNALIDPNSYDIPTFFRREG